MFKKIAVAVIVELDADGELISLVRIDNEIVIGEEDAYHPLVNAINAALKEEGRVLDA
jgi:hypothetical protein